MIVARCIIIGVYIFIIAELRLLRESLVQGRHTFKLFILLQHLVKVFPKYITVLPISDIQLACLIEIGSLLRHGWLSFISRIELCFLIIQGQTMLIIVLRVLG